MHDLNIKTQLDRLLLIELQKQASDESQSRSYILANYVAIIIVELHIQVSSVSSRLQKE